MAHVARVATQLTTTPPTTSATMLSPSSVTSAALTTTSTPTTVASPSKSKQSVTPTCGDFTSTHSMSTTTTVSMASGEAQPEALSKSIKSQLVLECRNCSFETTDKAQAIEHMNQHQVELSDDKEIMLMDTEDNGSIYIVGGWEGGREEGGEGDEGEEREEELEEQKEGEGLCLCKFALDCRL
uniref:C2H2-type domain-containing protein n=1 Tax=Syphacia muris TaxID=451379 RepID=A0A0N5ASP7_9BILA